MSTEATNSFIEALQKVVEYHRDEWNLTYSEAIGCLELVKIDLIRSALPDEDDEEQI